MPKTTLVKPLYSNNLINSYYWQRKKKVRSPAKKYIILFINYIAVRNFTCSLKQLSFIEIHHKKQIQNNSWSAIKQGLLHTSPHSLIASNGPFFFFMYSNHLNLNCYFFLQLILLYQYHFTDNWFTLYGHIPFISLILIIVFSSPFYV